MVIEKTLFAAADKMRGALGKIRLLDGEEKALHENNWLNDVPILDGGKIA